MDSRARRNLNQLNTELQDVQRIMVQNIDDVLQRGEQLSGKIFLQRNKYKKQPRLFARSDQCNTVR